MDSSDRFVISRNKCFVSVLDTNPGYTDENLEVFGVECGSEESAHYLAYELESMVLCLNGQHKELEKLGIDIP